MSRRTDSPNHIVMGANKSGNAGFWNTETTTYEKRDEMMKRFPFFIYCHSQIPTSRLNVYTKEMRCLESVNLSNENFKCKQTKKILFYFTYYLVKMLDLKGVDACH